MRTFFFTFYIQDSIIITKGVVKMPDNINSRLRQLRKTVKKSQEEFGKIIGISKSGISDIENGRRNVTEQHIIMLRNCQEFNVNETWLRTGQGKMFLELDREDEITKWLGSLVKPDENNEFMKKFIHMLSKLNVEDWKVLEKMAVLMAEENKKD